MAQYYKTFFRRNLLQILEYAVIKKTIKNV